MNTQMKTLFLSLLILGLAVSCFSAITTLTVKGGASRFQGDANSDINLNPAVGLSYEVWMTSFLNLGIHSYYTKLSSGDSPAYNFKTHAAGADVLLKIKPFTIKFGEGAITKMAPFFVIGGGFVNYFPQTSGAHDPQSNYIIPSDNPKYNAGVFPAMGGGLTIMTKSNVNIDLGFQMNNTKTDFLDGVDGGKNDDSFMMGYVGLGFNFGMKKDADKDGILDKNDADKMHAEDKDGFEDSDGAPDLDNDKDGVLDANDQDPGTDQSVLKGIMSNEDMDGFQDNDGVADPDNDNDGVKDINDQAPGTDVTVTKGINTKEDMDGFQDKDGVPDPDNDNDSILDASDMAPGTDDTYGKNINTKETANGYKDDDGMPDEVPVVAKVVEPKPVPEKPQVIVVQPRVIIQQPKPAVVPPPVVVPPPAVVAPPVVKEVPKVEVKKEVPLNLSPIYFKTGSTVLSQESKDVLDGIVKGLKGNPDVSLDIKGNTDTVGSAALNEKLALRRSQAARSYMINKGIEESRLTVKAYGPDKPADTNSTAAGKANNRRVDFVKN